MGDYADEVQMLGDDFQRLFLSLYNVWFLNIQSCFVFVINFNHDIVGNKHRLSVYTYYSLV